jgi:fructan beta-fructosidase
MKPIILWLAMIVTGAEWTAARAQTPDIVIANFEGAGYGTWKVEGTAFGRGPAQGTLPNQMVVEGFQGRGLVNSFVGGDGSTGALTSPAFTIDRKSIRFLIGGGGWANQTCINLIVDGRIVRTASGPNTEPGGSERLEPAGWDVSDLAGKTARLQIVDRATGGWGHINVDHIVLSDSKPPGTLRDVTRELTLQHRYLHLPVKTGAKKCRVAMIVDGATVREFEIELADDPDWWAHLDVSRWHGRKAAVRVDRLAEDSTALERVTQADEIWAAGEVYREPLRGQFHFSARRGWNNDPNGLVYAQGEYHLYFQHNPYGWNWGNMHWGHAVSSDLVHWQELPIAIYPERFGDWAFSGSAVVDRTNTSGWKKGDNDLLVAAFTSTGRGECIAFSRDRGRTWTEYEGNPVVKHSGRDPRLLWHEPTKRWVMAVYDESDGKRWIAFYTSADLKSWTFRSRIEGFFECPDLFELPVDSDATRRRWILTAASSEYMVGQFDGATFAPETPKLPGHRGRGFYAAQTFSHDPRGRVVQIGWLQTTTPGMPFNQGMSLPMELSLRTTPDGPRLTWVPVEELAALRSRTLIKISGERKLGDDLLTGTRGELIEIRAEFEPGPSSVLTFKVRGLEIAYDAHKHELNVHGQRTSAPLRAGKQRLIVYTDRTAVEVFASDGLIYVPMPVNLDSRALGAEAIISGGPIRFNSLEVHELRGIWGVEGP